MSRTDRRGRKPYVKPVQRIELSNKNLKRRGIVAALFLIVGMITLGFALKGFLSKDVGWIEIKASYSEELNASADFNFMYYLGKTDANTTDENKAVSKVYSAAIEKMYQIYTLDTKMDGVQGVLYINEHPNTAIEVDESLYQAFALIEQYGIRDIYLAPVFAQFDDIFVATSDDEAKTYDPRFSQERADEFKQICEMVANPEMIQVKLLGNNMVKLEVSEEYQKFYDENCLLWYIDFNWMKNAFIIDYVADQMTKSGFTNGIISSYDGFCRNLQQADGEECSNTVFALHDGVVYSVAKTKYTDHRSVISYRSFPLNDSDKYHYYVYKDGLCDSIYLDSEDGQGRTSIPAIQFYSDKFGCAEMLLKTMNFFIADEFAKEEVLDLSSETIYCIFSEGDVIYYNDEKLKLTNLIDDNGVKFTSNLIK